MKHINFSWTDDRRSARGAQPSISSKPVELLLALALGVGGVVASPASAEFPWKAATGDSSNPYAYEKYLYLDPGQFPPSDSNNEMWMFSSKNACELYGESDPRCDPAIANNPQELYGVTGASVDLAWETTTGRPDVVIAVTDSGIKWNQAWDMIEVGNKTWLNRGELPKPQLANGQAANSYDANSDGVFNVQDYASDPRVYDANRNGVIDPEDLIFLFSDGVDQDGNGYRDDISGWDCFENDNDPFDENQYGHGTGESKDSTGEANNAPGGYGTAPNCMVMHMRVGDSFIADINDFAEAVVYATDNGVSVIQCALGTLNNSTFAQEAIGYAYRRGVVLMASAADEEDGHHNLPAVLEHAVVVNSVGEPELWEMLGDAVPPTQELEPSYLEFRGCTNYGAYITASVPSNACSSEATGKSSGMAGLIYSAARNAVTKGAIADYGVLDGTGKVPEGRGVSAEEVHQVISTTADDINFVTPILYTARLFPETERFPGTEGWDPFFGYGRVNARRMVQAVSENKIPPEAYVTSPRWYEIVAPGSGPVRVEGSVAARRAAKYSYTVSWAVWSWRDVNEAPLYTTLGVTQAHTEECTAPISGLLATIDPGAIATMMLAMNGVAGAVDGPAADPVTGRGDQQNRGIPDKFSVIVRLEVTAKDEAGQAQTNIDGNPLTGISTKCFYYHDDPALFPGFPQYMHSCEAAPRFADLDNNGQDELIESTSDGWVHAYKSDGGEVPGWPAHTTEDEVHYGAPAYRSGEITTPVYAGMLRSATVGDIDRDGSLEVIVGDFLGRISVFDRHGVMRPGFPVRSNPAYSQPGRLDREGSFYAAHPEFSPGAYPGGGTLPNNPDWVPDLVNRKNALNSTARWFMAAPSLGDIDPSDDALEIIAGAADRHLYAFKADGSPVPGWPVMLRDPAMLGSCNPATHEIANRPGLRDRGGAMIVVSPAVGDIDGDGRVEIVAAVNEQYDGGDEPINSDEPVVLAVLDALGESGGNNRLYAIYPDGSGHGAGPGTPGHPNPNAFIPGWPVKIGTLIVDLLPVIAEGPTGAPVLANINGGSDLEVGVYGTLGPGYILGPDGASIYGRDDAGHDRTLLMEPFSAGSNSVDTPSILGLGGGIFTDLIGAGQFSFAGGAAGLGKLLDVFLPEDQLLSDNHLAVWDLSGTRVQLPAFPREVNSLQFMCTPASADIDGDGFEEILAGTAYNDFHAFNALGQEPGLKTLSPTGWPKFTGGWQASSAAVGDFDADGQRDVAVTTREGWLFVWEANGATACDPASWPEWGHDGWNTNNATTDAVRPRVITDLSAAPLEEPVVLHVEKVTGGGTIAIGMGQGNFGLNVSSEGGVVSGQIQFNDKNLGGPRVKSRSVSALTGSANATRFALHWTAPGDNGDCGQATGYEIRCASAPIAEDTWQQATLLANDIQPQAPGSMEEFTLPDLPSGTYYFVVQAVDDAGNRGGMSNGATVTVAEVYPGQATFTGTADVNGYPGHTFTAIVQDNGEPGEGTDRFEISLDTGYAVGGVLTGGNIQIHATPEEAAQAPTEETQDSWLSLFGIEGLFFLLGL